MSFLFSYFRRPPPPTPEPEPIYVDKDPYTLRDERAKIEEKKYAEEQLRQRIRNDFFHPNYRHLYELYVKRYNSPEGAKQIDNAIDASTKTLFDAVLKTDQEIAKHQEEIQQLKIKIDQLREQTVKQLDESILKIQDQLKEQLKKNPQYAQDEKQYMERKEKQDQQHDRYVKEKFCAQKRREWSHYEGQGVNVSQDKQMYPDCIDPLRYSPFTTTTTTITPQKQKPSECDVKKQQWREKLQQGQLEQVRQELKTSENKPCFDPQIYLLAHKK